MKVHMTIEEARGVNRKFIAVGVTYTFYSDCVQCETDNGELIRNYSGQPVTVVERLQHEVEDQIGLLKVRAANGDTFQVDDGELNGWIFDTGQWVGPRIH